MRKRITTFLVLIMVVLPGIAVERAFRFIYDESGNVIYRLKFQIRPNISPKNDVLEELEATASPNPTDGIVYVKIPDGDEFDGTVTLLNNSGTVLSSVKLSAEVIFDLTGFTKGIYYIIAESEYSYKTMKMIKE